MEPITDLGDLFDPAAGHGGGGLAVAQLERIFGSIIRVIQGDSGASAGADSWLVTAIGLFNAAGLLAVIVISLYTILTVIFDTANDGKTFGQGTDTRYTIMRSLMGAICFIPVAKGFTIAQILLLWLVIQGSALADKMWGMIATSSIEGQNFVQPSKLHGAVDAAVGTEFSSALNALVLGYICQDALNTINRQITGSSGDVVDYVKTSENIPMRRLSSGGDEEIVVRVDKRLWKDTSGASYRGADNICGSVVLNQTIEFASSESEVFDSVRTVASHRLAENYRRAMDRLEGEARSIATRISRGDPQDDIITSGVAAVDTAREIYISGLRADLADEAAGGISEAVAEVQQNAVEKITNDGWVLAPSWQRGISLAVAEFRSTLSSLDLDVVAQNNVRRFLSHRSWNEGIIRDGNPIAASVTAEMDEYQSNWLRVTEAITAKVQTSGAGAVGIGGGTGEIDGFLNSLFSMMIDLFAVRDDGGYSDPMIDVTEYGQGLILAGGGIAAAAAAADWAPVVGALTGGVGGYIVGEGLSTIGEVVLSPLGWALVFAGFVTASLIPLLPIIYFFSAVISWLILVVESLFAISLAVLTLFAPSREGTLLGSWNRILLTIFGVFLRPLFTVIGFFFGMLLIAVALDLAYVLFQDMILMMSSQGTIVRLISLLGIIVGFMIVSFYTVLLGSAMITQVGDGAMAAIGVAFSGNQGHMDVGSRTDQQIGAQRMLRPIPFGRLGGGGAPGRLGSAPARSGGPDGGSGGGGALATIPGAGAKANMASAAARGGAGGVTGSVKGQAGTVAGMPRGQRMAGLRAGVKNDFTPKRDPKGGGQG